ncbi:dual specificity protein kinase yak1 [Podila humilis]|nr:dual specificity protein kinase yak1 [Podila humilis]
MDSHGNTTSGSPQLNHSLRGSRHLQQQQGLQQHQLQQQLQQQQHQALPQSHTQRYRHVSAPVQQPQNLSSFQEGMRQDSGAGNSAFSIGSSPASETGSTGHVGINIDDHSQSMPQLSAQGLLGREQELDHSHSQGHRQQTLASNDYSMDLTRSNIGSNGNRMEHLTIPGGTSHPSAPDHQQTQQQSFLVSPPLHSGTSGSGSMYYPSQQLLPSSLKRGRDSGAADGVASSTHDQLNTDPLGSRATTLLPAGSSDSVSMTDASSPITGTTGSSTTPTFVAPRSSGPVSSTRYTNMGPGGLGIAPSSSSPSRSPVSPVMLQKSSSLRATGIKRQQQPPTRGAVATASVKAGDIESDDAHAVNIPLAGTLSPASHSVNTATHMQYSGQAQSNVQGHSQGHSQAQSQPSLSQSASLAPPPSSYYQSSTPTTGAVPSFSHSGSDNSSPAGYLGRDTLSPISKGQTNRNSQYSGMFQQGYAHAQYQGQLPGATLSRHLSIQLSPNATLLPPPPPPAIHAHSEHTGHTGPEYAMHSSYTMDPPSPSDARVTSLTDSKGLENPVQSRRDQSSFSFTMPSNVAQPSLPPPVIAQQSDQARTASSSFSSYQNQNQHLSQQSLQGRPVKYGRSSMMPQLSSQAMAFAQAQSQSQHRNQRHSTSSSYQHYASPPSSHVQQLPPRTHRRSIQPLTLEQQQPKGGPFRYVRNQADMWPQKGSQKYRSIDNFGQSVSPIRALTDLLTSTYSHCNRDFKYEPSYNPRRVLTKPSKPMHNEGYDNEDYDYILYVSDILGSEERQRYVILDVLGQGTFGQVVKCQNLKTNAIVAVKVIKNKPAYFNQSMMEVTVLELLNERYDVNDRHHILRLQDTFIHRRHLCLVFELLSVNLYELIKQNQFRGLSMSLVRVFTAQLLDALCVLNEARIIHCDLKPENVLLKNLETPTIKVIDFGSACHEQQTVYTYIQSRFYRSPEVLVGLPYSSSIDIWSVGCIAAELFLGLPLFPGSSEYNQLSRIVEMLGMLPTYMLEIGKTSNEFFEQVRPEHGASGAGPKKYRLKSMETYSRQHNVVEQPSKRYFQATTLPDIVNSYPMMKKSMTAKEIDKETMSRLSFINFLQGLLNLNPIERWSPHQAKLHPFITGEPFLGNFIPPTIPKKPQTAENSARLEPTLPGRSSKARSASMTSSSSTPHLSSVTMAPSSTAAATAAARAATTSTSSISSKQAPDLASSNHRSSHIEPTVQSSVPNKQESSVGQVHEPHDPSHVKNVPTTSITSSTAVPGEAPSGSGASVVAAPLKDAEAPRQNDGGATERGTKRAARFAEDTESEDGNNVHTSFTLPASHHQQNRPRATTMGTVDVPKNMAQLAAVITPQQQASSTTSFRIAPKDSDMSAKGHYGSPVHMAGGGLLQIPERSEQNSPVSEEHVGGEQQTSSSSLHIAQSSSQQTQQRLQQDKQTPVKYVMRSGSDSTGKMLSHRRASAGRISERYGGVSGTGSAGVKDSYRRQDHATSSTSNATASSFSVPVTSSGVSELTPLQKMQQQLIVGQANNKRELDNRRYHFGYPQSASSWSDSGSGVDSNNSSRVEGDDDDDEEDEDNDVVGQEGGHEAEAEVSAVEPAHGQEDRLDGNSGVFAEEDFGIHRLDINGNEQDQTGDTPDMYRNSNSGAESPSASSITGTSSLYSRSCSSSSLNRSADNDSPYPTSAANQGVSSLALGGSNNASSLGTRASSSLSPSPLINMTETAVTDPEAQTEQSLSLGQDQVNDGDDEDSSREAHYTVPSHVSTLAHTPPLVASTTTSIKGTGSQEELEPKS